MEHKGNARPERPMRQAIVFLVYDLILILLAYMSPSLWMTLICALLSVIAAIRAIKLFALATLPGHQRIEEELGLGIEEPQEPTPSDRGNLSA